MRSILMEFNNNTLCYRPTFPSTKKLQVFFVWCFFFPNGALPTEHLWRRDKRICTNPFYMNQIFMLYPLQTLSSSNLWNVISDLNTQAHLNQLPFELYCRLQRIFIHLYYRHMKTLWPSRGILATKHTLVQSRLSILQERAILWFSHVYVTIWCRVTINR